MRSITRTAVVLWGLFVCVGTMFSGTNELQSLIESARSGDTLRVPSATYSGNLLINKRIVLMGLNDPLIYGDGNGSVITITADSCVVSGFVIEHSGKMLVNEDAGVLLKSNGNRIERNDLRDVLFGIYLLHAERNTVADNKITGRARLDLGERGSGIHIWNSNYNTFVGNSITDMRDGFYFQNASHSVIDRNEAFHLRYGVHYMYADSNLFLRNKFHDNVAGAAIMYSRGVSMRLNVFSHNRGFASFGILFQDCHGLTADSNIICDNVVGMFLEASTENQFRNNVIALNDVALQMFQNSTNNTFVENNFLDNLNPLMIVGKKTESNWSKNGRGNYWTEYDGYDLDGDGIGDVPMKIQNLFGYLEGRNEAARLFLYSPAAQALAVAARAFPILDLANDLDYHPLMRPAAIQTVRLAEPSTGFPSQRRSAEMPFWAVIPLAGAALTGWMYRCLTRRRR